MSWKASLPPLQPIPVEPKVMWRLHVDILGPLQMTRNGSKYVAIAVDAFSKYSEAARNYSIYLDLIQNH